MVSDEFGKYFKIDSINEGKKEQAKVFSHEIAKNVLNVEPGTLIYEYYFDTGNRAFLYEVYKRMTKEQLIINISSNTVDENHRKIWPYQAAKAGLDKAIYQLQYINNGPMVSSVKFGWVGTEKIINDYAPEKYVSLDQVVKSVQYIIDAAKDGFLINNMLIKAHE